MKRTMPVLAMLLVFLMALSLMTIALADTVDDGTVCPDDPEGAHSWQLVSAEEATCVSAAKETYQCAHCGKAYSTSKGIPLGHDLQVNDKKAPTCTEPGYTHSICVRCKSDGGVVTVPALGHSWGDWEVIVSPTCTEGGYSEHACTRCGVTEKGQETAALGHDYQITDSKAPTYTEDGYNVYVCRNNAEHTYTEVVPMLTHTHDYQKEVTVAPTCTEAGTLTYTCSLCGDSYTQAAPALGHDWGDWKTTKAATCTEDGVETRVCKNDASHTETRKADALGHDWGDWVITQTANCGRNGVRTKTCKRDASHVQTETIPASGSHDWGLWTVETPGTCVKREMRHRRCYNCGKYDYSYGGFGDHDWGEWIIITPATETENGVKQRVCKNNPSHIQLGEIVAIRSSDGPEEIVANMDVAWDSDASNGKLSLGATLSLRCTLTNNSGHTLYFFKGDPAVYTAYQLLHESETIAGLGERFYLEPNETAEFTYVYTVSEEDLNAAMISISFRETGYYVSDTGDPVEVSTNPFTIEISLTKP